MSEELVASGLELIERLKKATGPDPELDAAIDRWQHRISGLPGRILMPWGTTRFTESIDAAMSLFKGQLPRGLHLYQNSAPDMGGKDWVVSGQSPTIRVAARSWPLALCIMAVKVLQQ